MTVKVWKRPYTICTIEDIIFRLCSGFLVIKFILYSKNSISLLFWNHTKMWCQQQLISGSRVIFILHKANILKIHQNHSNLNIILFALCFKTLRHHVWKYKYPIICAYGFSLKSSQNSRTYWTNRICTGSEFII